MHKIKSRRSSSLKSIISYIPHSIGPYLLDKEIGNGSFSVVYRAFLKKSKNDKTTKNKFTEEEQANDDGNYENKIKYNLQESKKIDNQIFGENPSLKNKKIKEVIPVTSFSRSKSFCSLKKPQSKHSNDELNKFVFNEINTNQISEISDENNSKQCLNNGDNIQNDSFVNQDNQSIRYYAIKIFPKSNLESQSDEQLFQREINAMAFFNHENIISLKDILSDDYNFYLVMDYCKGLDLKRYLTAKAPDGIEEKTAAIIFKQIVSAVSYCHLTGVAHRDLKPENILITSFPRIKISDFGLCGYITEDQLMRTFCGSPCYTAPECLSKIEYDGIRADTWSLGVILYTIITGNPPWPINNSSIMIKNIIKGNFTVPKSVSKSCKSLISAMLNVNPKERPTLDQIINHPWLNQIESDNDSSEIINTKSNETSENSDKFMNVIKNSYELKTSKSMTLAEFSEASKNFNKYADHGIYYPFTYVTEQNSNSSDQDYDVEEENNVVNDSFKTESKKIFSTNCDPNLAQQQQNQNSAFPIIKKQRKKPRRSDISSNMSLFDPKCSSLINTSSDDAFNSSCSHDTIDDINNKKIPIEKKKELAPEKKVKHSTLPPTGKKTKETTFTRTNLSTKKNQNQKLLKFPKRSKSHLNFF